MKLFKNKVGRPSNEIKMKRRSFYLIVTALFIALVGTFAVAISDIKTGNLKGNVVNVATKSVKVTYNDSVGYTDGYKSYSIKYTLKNNNKSQNYYYKWVVYDDILASHITYQSSCTILKKKTNKDVNVKLAPNLSYPSRMGNLIVYSDALCKNQIGNFKKVVKMKSNKLKYNTTKLTTKIGSQLRGKAWSAAMAYGVYIVSNEKKVISSPSSTTIASYNYENHQVSSVNAASASVYYSYIKNKLDRNIPVVMEVKTASSSHYLLAVGYTAKESNNGVPSSLSEIIVVDPYNSLGYGNKKNTLYSGSASNAKSSVKSIGTKLYTWN